ncbi:reverse transcriptase family protein [Photorhabdus africana]|uniref:reverse transcriptase family protein n=1 Tax=Photorhabdus africana TaxID=3097554 RepID=UPI002B403073|nr:reverse transcriptase family protein [Photorhabdus sp. CRI-LC]
MMKFSYQNKPISSVDSLAKALSISVDELFYLYNNSDKFYYVAKIKPKPDGSFRKTYDVKTRLKKIHEKINTNILKRVKYPDYLQGSLKERDFLSDANKHTNKKIIIKEDVSNFFPSISKKIVYQIWAIFFNFTHEVSEMLSELITYKGFVVQGCKTSSYICNLILWNREGKLVNEFKKRGFIYTRYVDDIHVSSCNIINKENKRYIINNIYKLMYSVGVRPNREKHSIMPKSNVQTVHNVNVDKTTPSFPKQKRNKIRLGVYNCEKLYDIEKHTEKYRKLYFRVLGQINMMKRLHEKEAHKLIQRLRKIRPENI